jgi:hypothetical protein
MLTILIVAGQTAVLLLLGAAALHTLPRTGPAGSRVCEMLAKAPLLDLVITYFTIMPLVLGMWVGGLAGLLGAIAGLFVSVVVWSQLHELAHPQARRGPRIVHSLNKSVGRFRNHAAVWWTALAVPIFWIVRVGEWVVYPPLTWIVRLPKYDDAEWVNVSRHKFSGLVGHDLIWCLYCDWMTGVWSLGSEMLRNVESFWCPIRFDSAKKCENCRVDFPDIGAGWVPATGTIAEAAKLIEEKYPPGGAVPGGENPWFGHPARLTVEGRATEGEKNA